MPVTIRTNNVQRNVQLTHTDAHYSKRVAISATRWTEVELIQYTIMTSLYRNVTSVPTSNDKGDQLARA